MKKILVLCTGNSCRSQMAQGYLKSILSGEADVFSAGVEIHGLNPNAVQVMKEDDIDISSHSSNHVDEYSDINFDYVITVCDHAKEVCPVFPSSATQLHHNFEDPAKVSGSEDELMEIYRNVRDEIKDYCHNFKEVYFTTSVPASGV